MNTDIPIKYGAPTPEELANTVFINDYSLDSDCVALEDAPPEKPKRKRKTNTTK